MRTEQKTRLIKRNSLLLTLAFALLAPLINSFIQYFYYYIKDDIAMVGVEIFLSYLMPFISYFSRFSVYALLLVSIFIIGSQKTRPAVAVFFLGIVLEFFVYSLIIYTLVGGISAFSLDGLSSLVYSVTMTVYEIVKTVFILIYFNKKIKKNDLSQEEKNYESVKQKLLKILFSLFVIIVVFEFMMNLVTTVAEIYVDGLPENFQQLNYLVEPLAKVVVGNLAGFFFSTFICKLLLKPYYIK